MKQHIQYYASPLGKILLSSDGNGLTGLWFDGQKYYASGLGSDTIEQNDEVLFDTIRWLDLYFSRQDPCFTPILHPSGTDYRLSVWNLLLQIPYGHTVTYKELASRLPDSTSPRAVGCAVGHNPVSLIIPCHRVIGSDGSLTGYAGGTSRKAALLELERHSVNNT